MKEKMKLEGELKDLNDDKWSIYLGKEVSEGL